MTAQQIAGVITALIGLAVLIALLNVSSSVHQIYVILPFLFMLGLGLALYPISKAETFPLYDTTQIPFKHMPFRMKICLRIGVVLTAMLLLLQEM